jgi:hypothetical protein
MLVEMHKTDFEIAKEEDEFERRLIVARSAAQRAQVEYERQREQLARSGRFTGDEATQIAAMFRARMLLQVAEDLRRSQESQLVTARQHVATAQVELGLVGANAETVERIRAQTQLRQQVEQEALRLYGDKDSYDRKHLEALQREAAIQAEINAQVRSRQLMQDIGFERSQMGRTEMEQDVYSRLKSAGMLTNGEIQGQRPRQLPPRSA